MGVRGGEPWLAIAVLRGERLPAESENVL